MQYDIKQTGIGKKENIEWMILLTLSLKERHNGSKSKGLLQTLSITLPDQSCNLLQSNEIFT